MNRIRHDRLTWVATVATVVTAAAAAGALPQGQGQGGGRGGGGGSDETPLIIVFRDADDDRVRSDGAAYIAGEPDIARAAFDDAGQVRLGFTQPKGKNGAPPSRHFEIELLEEDLVASEGDPPFLGTQDVNAYFHVSADFTGVRDVTETADARFPIFGEPDSALEGWKVSYSDSALADAGYDDRVTVTCVAKDEPSGLCYAWRVDKDDSGSHAVLESSDKKVPGAGVWSLPFAMGVCLRDRDEFTGVDPGTLCWAAVFGS